MQFNLPHNTTRAAARRKIEKALIEAKPHLKDQATINKEEWIGDTLTFDVTVQGKNITGSLEVTDTEFIANVRLPLMWRMFEGMIKKQIEQQMQTLQQGTA